MLNNFPLPFSHKSDVAHTLAPTDDLCSQRLFLIVEYSQEVRQSIEKMLLNLGAKQVEFARTADAALEKLSQQRYDVILSSYDLGRGDDGLTLLEEAKERSLIKQSCVFILLARERRAKWIMSAVELCPDEYLLRPFTEVVLVERLRKAVRRRTAFRPVDEAIISKDYPAAIRTCDEALAQHDEFKLDFLQLKGSLLLKIGEFEAAKNHYTQVLETKMRAWAKIGLAQALTGLQEYETASALFHEVLADNARAMAAYDGLTDLYLAQEDFERAEEILKKAIDVSPRRIKRQQQLAEVAINNGNFDTAQEASYQVLTMAKSTWHRHPLHYLMIARLQMNQGEIGAAAHTVAELRKDFQVDPVGQWIADIIESQIQLKKGNQASATRLLDWAHAQQQQLSGQLAFMPEAQLEFARAFYAQRRFNLGDAVVRSLVRNYHDEPKWIKAASRLFQEIGRAEVGEQLIKENIQSVVEINNVAVQKAKTGQFEQAIEHFTKAHEEMPSNLKIMLNLINAVIAYGYHRGWDDNYMRIAQKFLLRAREMHPENLKFHKAQQAWIQLIDKLGKPDWAI